MCKALCPFQTKIRSSCNKSYKIEYKVTVIEIFNIMITVHIYEENNVDFHLF